MSQPNKIDLLHEAIDTFIEEARSYLHEHNGTGEGHIAEAFGEWMDNQ